MRYEELRPQFVSSMPNDLVGGVLYISIRFRTASHLCACGCGSKVVTPIRPAKWSFTYDGEHISLWPSIGNWQKRCRSHYIIRKNRVRWARQWTEAEIAAGRLHDQAVLQRYYEAGDGPWLDVDRPDGSSTSSTQG